MTTAVDFKAYEGKKIKFNYTPPKNSADELARTIEGTIDMATDSALLIKERGSAMLKLIELSGIAPDTIEFIVDPPTEIKQKTAAPVTVGGARNHLLDKHGWKLDAINGTSDEDAYKIHNAIDHVNLGHVHEVRD
jgi:hypothetical protein